LALVQIHHEQVTALVSRINGLEARLKLNSTNSHKPPSSDFIGAKRKPPAPPTGKKRGGQPKHRRAKRVLVPPEKVCQIITCKPTNDRKIGSALTPGSRPGSDRFVGRIFATTSRR
jgi:transposase